MTRVSGIIAWLLVGGLLGLAGGYQLWHRAPVVETPLPEARQADGSVVIERAPDANAKPAHQLPAGATLERVVTLTVQPKPRETPTDVAPGVTLERPTCTFCEGAPSMTMRPLTCSCEPVHIDLSYIRLPDGSHRFIASARGDSIIGALDVPVESVAPPRVLKWGLGPTRELASGRWGGSISRDFERIVFLEFPYTVRLAHLTGPEPLTLLGMEIRF